MNGQTTGSGPMVVALIFAGGFSPVQLCIQAATWSRWAHVAAELDDGRIIDATFSHGVSVRTQPRNWTGYSKRIQLGFIPRDIRRHAAAKMLQEAGKPYDTHWLIDYTLTQECEWNDPGAWVCSELIWLGFDRFRTREQNRIAPKHIEAAAARELRAFKLR